MSKYPDPIWSPTQIKKELKLDLDVKEVHQKLEMMRESGLIYGTPSDHEYQGQKDGTFHLILQERLKNEISAFRPDLVENVGSRLERLKSRNDSLQGALSQTTGLLRENFLGKGSSLSTSLSPRNCDSSFFSSRRFCC